MTYICRGNWQNSDRISRSNAKEVARMMSHVMRFGNQLQGAVGHLDREHWIVISVITLAVGLFFLRGFGSRTGY